MTEPTAQPQPVMDWVSFAAAASLVVSAIGALLVFAGVTDPAHVGTATALVGKLVVAVGVIAPFVAHLWAGRKARAQVTPLASPVDNAGQALQTAEQWALEYGRHAAPDAPEAAPLPPTVFDRGTSPYKQLAANADTNPAGVISVPDTGSAA